MTLKTILHPTDYSESARQALQLAVRLAVAHDARLEIFHAQTLHADVSSQHDGDLQVYADQARQLAVQTTGGDRLELEASQGRAVFAFDAIMQAANDHRPDLIVMGTHGRSGFSKLLMGSNAEKLLRHAPCCVLTVKAGARVSSDGRFTKLMVPVDFSDWAGRALDAARGLQASDGSTVYLLHVVERVPPMSDAGNAVSRFELNLDQREQIESDLRTWSGDLEGARALITEGSPALEVARVAEATNIDLIVMSTKGLTGVDHLLVGSVTERVCRFAAVPVLTVR
jgi:nucleotide-binding universal stress UspA family protein